MTKLRIKAGLLGVDGCGARLLETLRSCEIIELIAVADRDRDLAKERAAELHVEAYDDYRSLVVEQPMDALFVAAPPFACHDQLKLAASKGVHVWRETPMARSVHEASELLTAFEQADVRFAVGRRWQFVYESAGLDAIEDLIGRPYSARGIAVESRPDPLTWRGDSDRAGGGVLIDLGYELVDAIVQNMGLPDEVEATTARRSGTQPYDTEDVATVALRYQNGSMAGIMAHRRSSPPMWTVVFDGPKGMLSIDPPEVRAATAEGAKPTPRVNSDASFYDRQIRAFAQAVLAEAKVYASPAAEHLATVAVIETAYLSARTGEAESPSHLYHLHDLPVPPPVSIDEDEEQKQEREPPAD
jgi:predicted dehydrogenase